MTTPRCDQCRFWVRFGDRAVGNCRRSAPKPLRTQDPDKVVYAVWPRTGEDEFCGDFVRQGVDERCRATGRVDIRPLTDKEREALKAPMQVCESCGVPLKLEAIQAGRSVCFDCYAENQD